MTAELYTAHFGFRERPFSLSPDPDFVFWSKSHARAFAVLEYGLTTRAPLTVVTGEVGTGKTMLIQALLRRVEPDVTLALISNAQGDRGDLMRWVLNALDVPPPAQTDYVSLFQHFQNFVIDEYAQGRHVALIIDEAQNLGADMLEELRMLTNINSGKDELLQIILCVQPELRALITQPRLRQFAQRVSTTFHLTPLNFQDTREYIRHRLEIAGGTGAEITHAAVRAIFEDSGGIPRLINKLCDLSLVYACSDGRDKVGLPTIRELMADNLLLKPAKPPLVLTDPLVVPHERAAE